MYDAFIYNMQARYALGYQQLGEGDFELGTLYNFRQRRLGWTTSQFQHKETGDRWSWLVALAVWLHFLSRPIVEDHPLPWQKPQHKLTPQHVQQRLPLIFAQFGSPARTPKMRAKSPGWPKDRHRTPKQRFKVVKKHPEPLYFDCQSTIFST